MMYAAPNRRTTHRLVKLDVPIPSWMRAPGECPGSFALESAMDELAVAAGVDPVELRARNEPDVDPESGAPFSSRQLVACLRAGAERFGWSRAGSAARTAPGRPVAGRVGRRLLDVPVQRRAGHGQGGGGRRRAVHGGDQRRRHRDRRAYRAAAGRGGHPGRCSGAGDDPDRGHPTAARRDRRRLDGDQLMGLGGGEGRRQGGGAACARWAPTSRRRASRPPRARTRTSDGSATTTAGTPSEPSSSRSGSTPTPARSGCRACSASSPRAGSSTLVRRARSWSAA